MEISKLEVENIVKATNGFQQAAIAELHDLQLTLVGGGCEVSFN